MENLTNKPLDITMIVKTFFTSTLVMILIWLLIIMNLWNVYKTYEREQKPEIYSYFGRCGQEWYEEKKFVWWQIGIVFLETQPTAMFVELEEAIAQKEGCLWEKELHFGIQNIKSLRLWN